MGKTVLVVDDSRFMRAVVRNECERNGCTVVAEADCSDAAVQKYKEFKPDIVTMDITMPGVDGIESLKLIKKNNPDAKVVMITAAGQKEKMLEAVKYGAVEFVAKPFVEETVIDALSKC